MLIKTLFGFLLLLILLTGKLLIVRGPFNSQTIHEVFDVKSVVIEITRLEKGLNILKGEFSVENNEKFPVWVMSDPIRANGVTGFYVSLAEEDSSTLEIISKVYYGPTHYDLSVNYSGVTLALLGAMQQKKMDFSIKGPVEETMPPYGNKPDRKIIEISQMAYVRTCVGIVPDNQSVREMAKRKYSTYQVNGLEQVEIGRRQLRLFEAQKLICSTKMRLPER